MNCAEQYILSGKSFEDMCEHNAVVSEKNNRFKVRKGIVDTYGSNFSHGLLLIDVSANL